MVIGKCFVCGSTDKITIHHMRDIHSKHNRKKAKLNGIIYLCRICHDIVEDIVNKGKSKKSWVEQGYQKAIKDMQKFAKERLSEGGQDANN